MNANERVKFNLPERVAYHEAGRVVMAWANGIVVKSATLVPDPRVTVDWKASGIVTPERAFAFYMGGYFAERRFDSRATHERNSKDDFLNAAKELIRMFHARRKPSIEDLSAEVDDLISIRWSQVATVAKTLVRGGLISH